MSTSAPPDATGPGAKAALADPQPVSTGSTVRPDVPRRATIRAQLTGLVLVLVLPLIAYEAWDIYDGAQADARRARAQVLQLAQITASETARFLGQARNILNDLAARPAVRALDPANCDPLMKDFLSLAPRFANVATLTMDGTVVCSAVPLTAPARGNPDRFLKLMRGPGQLTVGKPAPEVVTGRWVVPVGLPLLDARGDIAGAVVLPVDLASLPLLPIVEGLSANTVFGLLDADGTVLARSAAPERFVGTNWRDHAAARVVLRERRGTLEEIGLDGVLRIQGFAPVPGTGWIALVTIPASEAYAGLGARMATSALIVMLVLGAALLLAWRFGRQIVSPIAALANTVGEITAGNLAARAPVNGAAEIAEVAAQFNRMLDARLAAETGQREAHQRFQKLFQNAPMAATVSTLDEGHLLEVNDAFCVLLGKTREALLGRTALELGTWNDPGEWAALVERLRADGRIHGQEVHICHSGGGIRDVLMNAERIDYLGQDCTLQMGTDITERKRAEEKILAQLNELQRWYQATLGREDRVRQLKEEVNQLHARLGEAARYTIVASNAENGTGGLPPEAT